MRQPGIFRIILILTILLDMYVFQAVKLVCYSSSHKVKLIVYSCYWTLSAATILLLLLLPYMNYDNWPRLVRTYLFATIVGLFFAKLIATTFFLIDDIRRLLQWACGKIFFRNTEAEAFSGGGISRSVFLSWLGLGAGASLFGTLVYGFGNKYRYQVHRLKLTFENLPAAFKGLKIVQLSDIHSGSFTDKQAVLKGVEKVIKERPDLILFTGDLVNDRATEMYNYTDVFSRLQAPMGVYSILGNHDYGDYYYGYDPVGKEAEEKAANLENVKAMHGQLGWRLLLDEHVVLQRGEERIALIGVQNISGRRQFQTYGNMQKAYSGAEQYPFKILMSHDPSHWDAQVRPEYPEVDLTLAGHTHGMQFGLELPGFRWSPVEYIYKHWAGLYEEGKQKLYVNRGFGFIGYPGRVGILPEITVIELA
ncbi:MAG TPA: metallophosphoesterase [Chitinophagaceae bacterium]|nr:metallophosphoesterase [Chitinophagaceae bacterium]